MFKKDDYIVYKRDVCKIKDIFTYEPTKQDYYVLSPMIDESLTINVPVEDNNKVLRPIISKKEVMDIIDSITSIESITNLNDKMVEQEYKNILKGNKVADLIKIIKTAYLRNEVRLQNNKKISERDDNYLKTAEKLLYNEFAIALNMSYDETKDFVINSIKKSQNL